MTAQSTLTGAAGEHFVLCQLLRKGLIAALAPKGVPNADIIVTDIEGNRQCAIQVKTRSIGSDKGWHMSDKHELIISPTLFYCFVDMEDKTGLPITFVIPSAIVASIIKDSHQLWLDTPGKDGKAHNSTKMRRLLPDYARRRQLQPNQMQQFGPGWMEKYRENWDIINLK
jgi:hypothetical protein